ncbi:hypothetical protein B296_00033035 [Ensete ventricosum]|uniref:Uncharacterized protein n=1 Tax=Ensete ventricosum TaxID=4639 RepID=A0A426ZLL3_ENSVE|nr:hypothetical protein B296_00033035 [Ensete ventricosum]
MTKIVGTLGPKSRSVEVITACLKAGMSGKPRILSIVRDADVLLQSALGIAHSLQGLTHFDEILQEADGIILSRGNLGVDLPPEKVGDLLWPAEKVYNQDLYFKKTVKYVGEPMTHLESIASSAARQSLIVRGLFPMLADPRHPAEMTSTTNESVLKVALDHVKASGLVMPHDRVVVCQKVGDDSVVKIIELED